MARTVLLAPHCDDLAFSIGGLLLDGCLGTFQPVAVFTVSNFSNRHSPVAVEAVTECRKREERRFFRRIPGALAPVWLDLLDLPLRLGIDTSSIPSLDFVPTPAEVKRLSDALRELLGEGDRVVAPLGLGGHPDHRLVHLAACRLFAGGCDLVLYEDLPYAATYAASSIEAGAAAVGRRLGCEMIPRLWASSAIAAARGWAVRCYRSQVNPDTLERLLAHPRRLGGGELPAERIWLCRRPEGD